MGPGGAARYTLLAGAVAGHTVAVAGGATERSWSDGDTIYVPDEEGHPLRDALVVQASLLAVGSLEPKVVARTTGRRSLRHRYLTLEAARAMDALGHSVPRAVAERVAAVYDGPISESAEDSLDRASGRESVPEAPEWFGTIKPGKVLLNRPSAGGSEPTESDQQDGAKKDELEELDDEAESERSRIMELFSAPALRNPFADALQKLLGAGRSPKADSGGGDEMPVGGSRVGKVGRDAKRAKAPGRLRFDLGGPPVGRLYPEWDWNKRRYKEEWCSVAEYDPRVGEEPGELDSGVDRRLRRELARLGLAHERHRRQDEGDALDITALIEYVVDRGIGNAGDQRVYETKRRTAHDMGVLVLLDATGSTGESEEGRRVFDEQRQVAARLIAGLHELGDRVAGYGFQSWGRNGVRFLRIKGFDDRYDHAAQRRLAAVEPSGFTRLGAAIRHGTHLLTTKSGTSNNLLVVVGDGLPYDDGYEHRYAQEDSRRALMEAVAEGVGCACVSVRTATEEDVLERVWGHVPYRRLEQPSELARHVTPLFRQALREAAASGRS